ncbi:hypothetical protein [Streptomyces wuyuanensis]|uniref:hypothetical protein n=1 Tax=Streptomyces wuyuanensis TaxID=1196353 RepID=UPI0037AC09D9
MSADSWEQVVEDGRRMGQVDWLLQSESGPVAGLWKVDTAKGAELPYRVTGSDSFHVIEGEAELESPSGDRIELVPGGIYSFPDGFTATFPDGFTATWRTRSPFLTFFVIA